MLDFFRMMGNWEDRKVARYPDSEEWIVDTCAVTDSSKPYETAVKHPAYNSGKMVIVELYDSQEEAQAGHDKWVGMMTAETLPERLTDVSTAGIALLANAVGCPREFLNSGGQQ